MSETEMLTSEEIEILEAVDKGIPESEIAKKLHCTVEQARQIVRRVQQKREHLRTIAEERKMPSYIRMVDGRLNATQKGTMKVGSRILKYLSEGIYSSPAGSLKELISNSYDNDATEVKIRIDENEVSIWDNGYGMDWADFDRDFTYITYSIKRLEGEKTQLYNRPIIGFLGIGFISVSELCDTLIITSCKKDSDIFFEAKIDFSRYREPATLEKEFYEVSEYELTNYEKKDRNIPRETSFTEIRMKNLRPGFKKILLDREPFGKGKVRIEDILEHLSWSGVGITGIGEYWQMILELAFICPVRYPKDGPVRGVSDKKLLGIKSSLDSYNFRVVINDMELVKPIRLPMSEEIAESPEKYAIHPITESIPTSKGRLSLKGYIYSQHGIINPKEYIGILFRVKNVAIGGIDRALMQYPSGTNQLFRNWIFGEIYIDEGLEEAMNINRNKFKVTHPNYIILREWLHNFLNDVVFKHTLYEYYRKSRDIRQERSQMHEMQTLASIIKSEMGNKYDFRFDRLPENKPVEISKEERKVVINTAYPLYYQTPKKFWVILQRIFVIFEIATEKSEGNMSKLKRMFREGIEKWINE